MQVTGEAACAPGSHRGGPPGPRPAPPAGLCRRADRARLPLPLPLLRRGSTRAARVSASRTGAGGGRDRLVRRRARRTGCRLLRRRAAVRRGAAPPAHPRGGAGARPCRYVSTPPTACTPGSSIATSARTLRQAGFVTLRLGLETADPGQQRRDGDKVDRDRFARAVEALWAAGYTAREVMAYVLIGRPGQDVEAVRATVAFAHGLGVPVSAAQFSPIPGTREGEAAVRRGTLRRMPIRCCTTIRFIPAPNARADAWEALKVQIRARAIVRWPLTGRTLVSPQTGSTRSPRASRA